MDPVAASVAILIGVVPIAAAIVSIVPNMGRLRRLERIVELITKVDDAEAKQKLKAMRDRLILAMEPKKRWSFLRTYGVVIVSYVVLVVGFSMWLWTPLREIGSLVELIGALGIIVGFFVWVVPRFTGMSRRMNDLNKKADGIERRQDGIEAAPRPSEG